MWNVWKFQGVQTNGWIIKTGMGGNIDTHTHTHTYTCNIKSTIIKDGIQY